MISPIDKLDAVVQLIFNLKIPHFNVLSKNLGQKLSPVTRFATLRENSVLKIISTMGVSMNKMLGITCAFIFTACSAFLLYLNDVMHAFEKIRGLCRAGILVQGCRLSVRERKIRKERYNKILTFLSFLTVLESLFLGGFKQQ